MSGSRRREGTAPNIFDVARLAGVSIATVSRFINSSGYVSEENRRRIEQAITELDFTPSVSARSLNTRRSHVIGFVVSSIAHPYSAEVARGIQDVASAAGYVVLVSSTDGRANLQLIALRALHAHRVDAAIVTPPESPETDRYLDRLVRQGMVVVLIGRHLDSPRVDTVTTDTRAGANAVMQHLLDLGHRRIGFLGGPHRLQGTRFDTYQENLVTHGISVDPELALSTDLTLDGGSKATLQLLRLAAPPTAIFCIDDLVAIGSLQAVREAGYRVPEDISIVGFDDDTYARLVEPPLTTVAQPSFDIGRIAAERVLARLRQQREPPTTEDQREIIRLPCQLIVRESTGIAPPQADQSPGLRSGKTRVQKRTGGG